MPRTLLEEEQDLPSKFKEAKVTGTMLAATHPAEGATLPTIAVQIIRHSRVPNRAPPSAHLSEVETIGVIVNHWGEDSSFKVLETKMSVGWGASLSSAVFLMVFTAHPQARQGVQERVQGLLSPQALHP